MGNARVTTLLVTITILLTVFAVAQSGPSSFFPDPQTSGTTSVTLHPTDAVSPGETVRVSFGIPFPKGYLSDLSTLRILQAGSELPIFTKVLTPYRDFSTGQDAGSIRSALVQVDVTFPSAAPVTLDIEWGVQGRTLSALTEVSVRDNWELVDDFNYPASHGVYEPPVIAVFNPTWYGDATIKTRLVPMGTYQDFSFFDTIVPEFAKTAVNDVPQNILDAGNGQPYLTSYANWLFDRAMTLYQIAFRTSDVNLLREAHRAAQFYENQIDASGDFSMKGPDLKYVYGEPVFTNHMLTGDPEMIDAMERMIPVWENNFNIVYDGGFWTERHAGFKFLGMTTAFEMLGDPSHATLVRGYMDSLIAHQENPPFDSYTGALMHTSQDHAEGGSESIASPWMTTLLIDAVQRYYLHSGDSRVPSFVMNMADFMAQEDVAIYYDTEVEDVGYYMPYYLAGEGLTTRQHDLNPWVDYEHAFDVSKIFSLAYYFSVQEGTPTQLYLDRANALLRTSEELGFPTWIRPGGPATDRTVYRLAPPRKFSWWFRTTMDNDFLLNGEACTDCPTCFDGIQNQDETGVDCGGTCSPCPSCDDGIQNQDETGVDCGGSCGIACPPEPACDDGVQNGDEVGIDCGGSCNACGNAEPNTLYVSAQGNDANDCLTPQTSCRQIQRAINFVGAGDTVSIGNGDYLGFSLENVKGTAQEPVVFRAEGGDVNILPSSNRGPNDRDNIFLLESDYIIFDGINSYNAERAGLAAISSHFVTVRNGRFGDNDRWGVFSSKSNNLVAENNEMFNSAEQHGMYFADSADNPTIRNNIMYNNGGAGLQLNADLSYGSGPEVVGDGIITGALVENNIVYGNSRNGGAAFNFDGVQDAIVRNNLLYDNHATGIALFRGDGAEGPANVDVYHNTIDMASDSRWALQVYASAGEVRLANNIIVARNTNRGVLDFNGQTDVANTQTDNNIFAGQVFITTDAWASRLTLAQWQALGKDQGSLASTDTELFASPQNRDYHLASGSLAIDFGTELGVSTDLDGNVRPEGQGPDAGAYESDLPPPPQTTCELESASWNQVSAVDGTLAGLTIASTGCEGEELLVTIKEADLFVDEAYDTLPPVTITGQITSLTWQAQYQEDGLGNPEYIFEGEVGSETIVSSNELIVTEDAPPIDPPVDPAGVVNPDTSDLFVTLPTSGKVQVVLHPLSADTVGQERRYSFGIPFPKGVIANPSQIRLLDANDNEIPASVLTTSHWYNFITRGPASIRSALVQFDYTFPSTAPMTVYVEYGQSRTQTISDPLGDITDSWKVVDSYLYYPADYAVEESGANVGSGPVLSFAEPRMYATFTPEWLSANLLHTRFLPQGESASLAWYDEAFAGYSGTATNNVRPSVTDGFKTDPFRENSIALFDRTGALLSMYYRTGDVKWLRAAHREGEFYKSRLDDGYYNLAVNHPDMKYSYGRAMLQLYMLTGDPGLVPIIERMGEIGGGFSLYSPSAGFWTERHAAYSLLNSLAAFEVTGDAIYRDRVEVFVTNIFESTLNPPTGETASGCVVHNLYQHRDGSADQHGCSPWMTALLADALWQYYQISHDVRTLEWLENVGHYVRNHATYYGDEGNLAGRLVPWYLATAGEAYTDSGQWADMEHACDVGGIVAKSIYAAEARGNPTVNLQATYDELMETCEWNILDVWFRPTTLDRPQYRTAPGRKYTWVFGTTTDMGWLQAQRGSVPPIQTGDVTPPARLNALPLGTLPAGTGVVDISLQTDEEATCRMATVPGVSYAGMSSQFNRDSTGTYHSLNFITIDDTAYDFYIRCIDVNGNVNTNDFPLSFGVAGPSVDDTIPPSIQDVDVSDITNQSATISWTTDEYALSRLEIGTSLAYGTELETADYGVDHSFEVTLAANTQYYYRVTSSDALGNTQSLGGFTFVTEETPPSVWDLNLIMTATAACDAGDDPHWQCAGRWTGAWDLTLDSFIGVCPSGPAVGYGCSGEDLYLPLRDVPSDYGIFVCPSTAYEGLDRNGCQTTFAYLPYSDFADVFGSLGANPDDPPVETCSDGILNQNEEDVDCGGVCAPCDVIETCNDGFQNQDETGVDCGGVCPACAPTETCSDGVQNQDETGIDCGGVCPACAPVETCSDGVRNQDETGIDCGGVCAPCQTTDPGEDNHLIFVGTSSSCVQGDDPHWQCGGEWADPQTVTGDTFIGVCPEGIVSESYSSSAGGCSGSDLFVRAKHVPSSYSAFVCPSADALGERRNGCAAQQYAPVTDYVDVASLRAPEGDRDSFPALFLASNDCSAGADPGWACNAAWRRYASLGDSTYIAMCPSGAASGYGCAASDAFRLVSSISDSEGVFVCHDLSAEGSGRSTCKDIDYELASEHLTTVPAETCTDGILNQNEEGIDCGGVCPACAPVETCDDGIQNQDETGIDCGGTCGACPVVETCNDGVQNQNELGVDCGGICQPCSTPDPDPEPGVKLVFIGTSSSCVQGDDPHWQCSGEWADPQTVTGDTFIGVCPNGIVSDSYSSSTGGCSNEDLFVRAKYVPSSYSAFVCHSAASGESRNGCATQQYGAILNYVDVNALRASEGDITTLPTLFLASENCNAGDDPGWACGATWKGRASISDATYLAMCPSGAAEGYGCSGSDSFQTLGDISSSQGVLVCHDVEAEGATRSACHDLDYELRSAHFTAGTCSDGILNQNEEGVDCGGPCSACAPVETCNDGIQNQDETGTDCGGVCSACAPVETCNDGIQNQDETGTDCGGVCSACAPVETCNDGILNQNEEGVDCGGLCSPCETSTGDALVFSASESCTQGHDPHWQCEGRWVDASTVVATTWLGVCTTGIISDEYSSSSGGCSHADIWLQAQYIPEDYTFMSCSDTSQLGGERNDCAGSIEYRSVYGFLSQVDLSAIRSSDGSVDEFPELFLVAQSSCSSGDDPGWACNGEWTRNLGATDYVGVCPNGATGDYNSCGGSDTFEQSQDVPSSYGYLVCLDLAAEGERRSKCAHTEYRLQ